jgi:hypothetical protein
MFGKGSVMEDRMQDFGTRAHNARAGVRGAMRSDARKRTEERRRRERCCEVAEDRVREEEQTPTSSERLEYEMGQ